MSISATYEKEFAFFQTALNYYKIPHHLYSSMNSDEYIDDCSLRQTLELAPESLNNLRSFLCDNIKKNSICYFTDEFCCHYIALLLPSDALSLFIIGPYITTNDRESIWQFINQTPIAAPWQSALKKHYAQICALPNEDILNGMLFALSDSIWGTDNYTREYLVNGPLDSIASLATPPDPQHRLDLFSNVEQIEKMYLDENELINAIAHGQMAKARSIFSGLPLSGFNYEMEPLRNLKTFTIIINTLFRKAAQQGGVHPIYVYQLSNTFISRIENINRTDNIFDLWTDMIQRYCMLVNNHSTRNYSLPVQKAIARINLDLSADLSLNATAEFLKVNASYLSNLFKKETGYTLTSYVNKKRMEQAAYLLASTTLPISAIAQQCGILDDNYFTKLFKKHRGVTPSQFREKLMQEK